MANDYEVYLTLKIIPTDLTGKTVNGVRVNLAGQGLPTPYEGNSRINGADWGATADWSCQLGSTSSCQGTTALTQGVKSQFVFFVRSSLAGAPPSVTVTLLTNGQSLTTLSVPLQNP